MPRKVKSPSLFKDPLHAFKGFKLSKNFWSAFKNAVYVLVPAFIAELVSNNILSAGVAGVISSAILKAIEYALKEY